MSKSDRGVRNRPAWYASPFLFFVLSVTSVAAHAQPTVESRWAEYERLQERFSTERERCEDAAAPTVERRAACRRAVVIGDELSEVMTDILARDSSLTQDDMLAAVEAWLTTEQIVSTYLVDLGECQEAADRLELASHHPQISRLPRLASTINLWLERSRKCADSATPPPTPTVTTDPEPTPSQPATTTARPSDATDGGAIDAELDASDTDRGMAWSLRAAFASRQTTLPVAIAGGGTSDLGGTGVGVGATFELLLPAGFGAELGAHWVTDTVEGTTGGDAFTFSSSQLSLPVRATWRLGLTDALGLRAGAGVAIDLPMGAEVESDNAFVSGWKAETGTQLGWTVGIGADVRLGGRGAGLVLPVELRWTQRLGTGDANTPERQTDGTFSTAPARALSAQVELGWIWP